MISVMRELPVALDHRRRGPATRTQPRFRAIVGAGGHELGKKARETRKAAAAANEAERELARLAHEQRVRRNRTIMIALPLVTAVLAGGVYFALDARRAAAAIIVVGLAFWVPVLLGTIGGSVPPRDRSRSGSIDFGRRD